MIRRKLAEVRRGLALTVDGRPARLAAVGAPRLSLPRRRGRAAHHPAGTGAAGTRLGPARAWSYATRRSPAGWDGRPWWPRPGEGTGVRSTAPGNDPTGALRRYPKDLLNSPADRREARFSVEPGNGTLIAPRTEGGESFESRTEATGGFARVFEDAASGRGVLLLLLLAAFGWGALHALSPGHGKAMVAAYLVGTRGRARHAIALGGAVTVTHTIGVFALGVVTLALSQYVLAEDLYPWLTLISGLMVVTVGGAVLRSRLRHARAHAGGKHHHHHHHHDHDLSWKGLIGMGAAAGLIPCPSALVVLLAAISQHEVGLGLLLIVAFSLGLAGTLAGLGLAVVYARNVIPPRLAAGRLVAALPAVSALLIVTVGMVLTLRAVPEVV